MNEPALAGGRIRAGLWEAELSAPGEEPPAVEIWHLEKKLDGVKVGARSALGTWPVSAPIPAVLLSEGVQTFLVKDAASDTPLGQFTIVTGAPLEDDIRAELDLLRAELDLLKKAFRRHCLDSAGS